MRNDPVIYSDGQLPNTEATARNASYKLQLDTVLGRPYEAAKFLHRDLADGFQKEPRPRVGPVSNLPPSPGVRRKIALDSALRSTPVGQQILSQLEQESRAEWYASIRARLGKHIPGQQPQARPKAQTHTTVDVGGGESDGEYFARLRSMLGGRQHGKL
jgi:hypothetical protein